MPPPEGPPRVQVAQSVHRERVIVRPAQALPRMPESVPTPLVTGSPLPASTRQRFRERDLDAMAEVAGPRAAPHLTWMVN